VLLTAKLRPGDIYTHSFSGARRELAPDGKLNPGMPEGRKRGVIFDVGHVATSFTWRVAAAAMKQGFYPDSISSDLHTESMNTGLKDLLNVMSKFLALGMSVDDVIARVTWHPARQIQQEQLGHLSVGAPADVTVLRVENGTFGFTDSMGARLDGKQKFVAELTIRNGKVVFDLNGITRPDWRTLPADYRQTGDAAWDAVTPAPRRPPQKKQ
jgi:dihydroorotase